MSAETRTVRLFYRSRRALDADHSAYLVHGGMLVPQVDRLPPMNSSLILEVVTPEGRRFRLASRAGRAVPGRGFLVSFEPDTTHTQADLRAALQEPAFIAARDAEPESPVHPPQVDVAPDGTDSTEPVPTSVELGEPVPEDPAPETAPDPSHPPIRRPLPGESYLAVVVRYPTVLSYLPDVETLQDDARLVIERPDREFETNRAVLVRLTLPGHYLIELWSTVEEVGPEVMTLRFDPGDERYRRACLFPSSHQARNRREREEARGEGPEPRLVLFLSEEMPEAPEKMPLRRRIKRMGMEDKINLALSGNREERMALAQDSNRSIHHYLLKNAKLTIDEIAFMSRLPSLNPDVLEKIAENPGYTQNPAVTKALVFNPRTPLRTALRLLDRLPRSELNVLSRRTGMNKRLVLAAKNKIVGNKW